MADASIDDRGVRDDARIRDVRLYQPDPGQLCTPSDASVRIDHRRRVPSPIDGRRTSRHAHRHLGVPAIRRSDVRRPDRRAEPALLRAHRRLHQDRSARVGRRDFARPLRASPFALVLAGRRRRDRIVERRCGVHGRVVSGIVDERHASRHREGRSASDRSDHGRRYFRWNRRTARDRSVVRRGIGPKDRSAQHG